MGRHHLSAVALVGSAALSLLALSSCGGPAELQPPTVTQVVTVAPSSSSTDQSVRDLLRAAGANEAAVHALAVVAQSAGYVWQSRPPTAEEADNFAYMALLECQEIASGERSWTQSLDDALQSGASTVQATRMTAYLRSTYCPMVANTAP
jgi:hypothetical protein